MLHGSSRGKEQGLASPLPSPPRPGSFNRVHTASVQEVAAVQDLTLMVSEIQVPNKAWITGSLGFQ